jgi:hypothetical protein
MAHLQKLPIGVLWVAMGMAVPITGAPSAVIPPDVYEAAGLSKLSEAELAALEGWITGRGDQEESAREVASGPAAVVTLPVGDDRFGFEQVTSRVAAMLQSNEDRIETRIDGPLKGWSGSTIFHLQNGQRWQQIDDTRVRYKLDDAEVVLFRGAMGTYFLKPKALNSRVRVRRLE